MSVNIDSSHCAKCKACYHHCPNDVIGWRVDTGTPFIAYPDECSHCGVCALECKFGAIRHTIPLTCYDDVNLMTPAINRPASFDWRKWL